MDGRISPSPRLVSKWYGLCFDRRVRRLLLPLCLFAVVGCGSTVTGPTVPLDEPFVLAIGEAATIASGRLVIEFNGVTGDSRCPADALCIQGGDAIVNVRVSSGGSTATYELHTGDDSRADVTHGSFRITLIQLLPYPFSSRTIPQGEYRATFTVSRL